MKGKDIGKGKNNDTPFARLLNQSFDNQSGIEPGTHVSAVVKDIKNKDYIFVQSSLGAGLISREELVDEEGNVTINPGEKLDAFYANFENGEHVYTTIPGGRHKDAILAAAVEKQIPMQGEIIRQVKGGYEVRIGEAIAFCPASQMDQQNVELKATLPFILTEFNPRRIIASHKVYRDIQRERQKDILKTELNEGDVVSGNVLSLHDFGAFVDLGGVEALVPTSELSFHRIRHPSEVLHVGQEVRAVIMSIDWKEDKITLSYKSLLKNPWQGALPFQEKDIVDGTIETIKNFGFFVKLSGAFTGLVPNSESGLARGTPIEKHFHNGQEVRVMVMKIDRENQRISLSVNEVREADVRKEYEEYMSRSDDKGSENQENISSFGKALLASLNKSDEKKANSKQ